MVEDGVHATHVIEFLMITVCFVTFSALLQSTTVYIIITIENQQTQSHDSHALLHRVWTSKQGINNIMFLEIVSKLYIHSSNDVKKKSFQVLMFTLASWRLGGMKLCMVIDVLISELLQQARLDSLIC